MNARDYDDVPRYASDDGCTLRYHVEALYPNDPDDEWDAVNWYERDIDAAWDAGQAQIHEFGQFGDASHMSYLLFRVYDTETNTVIWPAKKTT